MEAIMYSDTERIRERAYQLFKERIGNSRAPLDDWLKAEWEEKNRPKEKKGTTIESDHEFEYCS